MISPNKVLAHMDRLWSWKCGTKPAPVTVEWDLSNRCSLGCQSCHFAHTHVRGPWVGKNAPTPASFRGTGEIADTRLVIKGLEQARDAGVLAVVWSGGGEPTLHPEWERLVQWAGALGLKQGMYTLGGHLTPESAEILAKLTEWVVVSLDAADRQTYAKEKGVAASRFEAATNGIRMLAEAGGRVGVSFLLHAENWFKAPDMLHLARNLGASYCMFRPTIETSPDAPGTPLQVGSRHCEAGRPWVTEGARRLFRYSTALHMLVAMERKDHPFVEINYGRFREYGQWTGRSYSTCHGIKLNATITPDGRVWICPQRRGMLDSLVGDLRKESFSELWKKHPGCWTDFSGCRMMCRLHQINQTLAPVFQKYEDVEFL